MVGHLVLGTASSEVIWKQDCFVMRWKRRDALATVITWSVASRKVESRTILQVFSPTFLVYAVYGTVKIESVFWKLLKFLAVFFEC